MNFLFTLAENERKTNFESREKDLSRLKISLIRNYFFANENMSLLLKSTLYVK